MATNPLLGTTMDPANAGRMQTALSGLPQLGRRNNAKAGVLRKFLGIEGPDNGEFSQADLQDAGDYVQRQTIERDVAPKRVQGEYDLEGERIRGQYGVQAAGINSDAALARAEANQNSLMERLLIQSGAVDRRQDKTLAAGAAKQEDAQAFKAGQTPGQGLAAIARQRQALVAAQNNPKNAPGALARMFGSKNPVDAQLAQFDNTLKFAQRIQKDYPDASAEEALAALGADASPEELAQIQSHLLMLRGH